MSDEQLDALEKQFVQSSATAFTAARQQALAAGQSVLSAENGRIYRLFPDGRREFVKQIPPPRMVEPGTRIQIR